MSKMPSKKDETDTKAEVKKLLDEYGWFWFMPPANMYGKSGISDILAVKQGVFLAIEVKRGTGAPKPTTNQIGFLNSVRAEQCFAFVVNDTRLPHLGAFLAAFSRSTTAAIKKELPTDEDGATMLNCIKEMTEEL